MGLRGIAHLWCWLLVAGANRATVGADDSDLDHLRLRTSRTVRTTNVADRRFESPAAIVSADPGRRVSDIKHCRLLIVEPRTRHRARCHRRGSEQPNECRDRGACAAP